MGKARTRAGCGLVGVLALAILLYATLWVAGSAMVFDKGGHVISAVVTNDGGSTQPLHHLPFGTFYAIPQMEGTIEVRCDDGSRHQEGYVTGNMHTWIRVDPGPGCGRIAEDT